MTALCIVTPPGFPTEPILAHVRAAGVEPITSAEGKIASIEAWQEQIRRVNPDPDEPLKIGTFWKQILTDFYLNTLECNCWGWHLGDDLRFLDFWHEFDPSIRFLLISVAPEFLLAYQLDHSKNVFQIIENHQTFETWHNYHQKILSFHRNQPDQTVIIDLEEFLSAPKEAIQEINSRWPCRLSAEVAKRSESTIPSPLAKLLTQTVSLNLFPEEVLTLKHEIDECRTALPTETNKEPQDQVQAYQFLRQTLESTRNELETAKKQIEELKTERNQLQQQLAQLEKEFQTLKTTNAQLEHAKTDVEEENELILTQLHQAQEELEHYFLQFKDAEQAVTRWQSRWARMLERNPDFIDYERLSIVPEANAKEHDWQFEKIDIAGRSFEQLKFRTAFDGETVHLTFQRENFTRWPHSADNTQTLTITSNSIEILQTLSTSDWALIKTLAKFLATHGLETPEAGTLLDYQTRTALRAALQRFASELEQLPPTFRYDQIELKREQINPDYEHLWFRFHKAQFGKRAAPAFEFRFSCANVRPNSFGKYPKLEFPEGDGASLFEQWYEESWDDFSSKWELRFALPRSMDLEVFNSVSEHDQALICSLMNKLPIFFTDLKNHGFSPRRGWAAWQEMAEKTKRIVSDVLANQ